MHCHSLLTTDDAVAPGPAPVADSSVRLEWQEARPYVRPLDATRWRSAQRVSASGELHPSYGERTDLLAAPTRVTRDRGDPPPRTVERAGRPATRGPPGGRPARHCRAKRLPRLAPDRYQQAYSRQRRPADGRSLHDLSLRTFRDGVRMGHGTTREEGSCEVRLLGGCHARECLPPGLCSGRLDRLKDHVGPTPAPSPDRTRSTTSRTTRRTPA
jgi:hypothetical protein